MRLMICANLNVGGLPGIDLPAERVTEWEQNRIEALAAALEDARARGADACVFAGGLCADGFVAQSLLTDALKELGGHGLPAWYVPLTGEADDLERRVNPEENVTVAHLVDGAATLDVRVGEERCQIAVRDASGLDAPDGAASSASGMALVRDGREVAVYGEGKLTSRLGALEPAAFGEALPSGYLLATVTDGKVAESEWVGRAKHPFVVREVALDEPRTTHEVVTTVGEAVKDVDREACLRVELRGSIPLDVYVNTGELAEQLQRYFAYVEVADECVLDIDVEALGSDVSLLAEFVRQVTGDDTLSETEKTRILRCGWNALNGKELVE